MCIVLNSSNKLCVNDIYLQWEESYIMVICKELIANHDLGIYHIWDYTDIWEKKPSECAWLPMYILYMYI